MRSQEPTQSTLLYRDREAAGQSLGALLEGYRGKGAVVLGIADGGVAVAAEVARSLDADLDVIVARKVRAQGWPQMVIGAVTADGAQFLDRRLLRVLEVSEDYLHGVLEEQRADARSREANYRGSRPPAALDGQTVVVVDDGLVTGSTMRAVVRSAQLRRPVRLIVAIPLGTRDACAILAAEVDELVCPHELEEIQAVGQHYGEYDPVDVATIRQLLDAVHADRAPALR